MNSIRELRTPCPVCGAPMTQQYEVERSMGDSGLVPITPAVCSNGHRYQRALDEPLPD